MSTTTLSYNLISEKQRIGYEGMRSFALATSKVGDDDLQYWLNKSSDYAPGLMKAAYGTFLTDLIFLYEHDYVADLAAEAFNVNWQRTSPVGFSLCNDYNCLYITGESDHSMGMTVAGDAENVWKFRFTCSFAYSLLEQLVGTNIWEDYNIGSVTLGLLQRYMNNESLELIYENGYYFLKVYGDDTSLLVFDPVTGLVRDIYSFNGLLGSMPCYHDGITDNAIAYANNLLDETSVYNIQLDSIHDFSSSIALIGGFFVSDSLVGTGEALTLAELSASSIAFMIIALPVIFELNRPKLAEMLENMGFHRMAEYYHTNNTIDILWDAIEYLNLGELDNVPFEQRLIFALFYLSSINTNVLFTSHLIINPNSDLYESLNLILKSLNLIKENKRIQEENKIIYNYGIGGIDPKGPFEHVGEELNKQTNLLKQSFYKLDIIRIIQSVYKINFIFLSVEAEIINAWGKEITNILLGSNNTNNG